ncbi:hypothetical protein [Fictibacillus nanhaiensis]|uniref:hypothetical protein n=1 Tax=Fictibacillus nanhaiensis TaxID=742169 RepID=UPI003C26E800
MKRKSSLCVWGGERRFIGGKSQRSGGYYHVTGGRDVTSGGKRANRNKNTYRKRTALNLKLLFFHFRM